MARRIFYSFHFDNDVMKVQQIRNIGVLEGNKPVSKNKWETIKREGEQSIKRWINKTMSPCSCVIVLVGEETANRKWVQYEIQHAWKEGKGVLGIYINNIKDPNRGKGAKGENPFNKFVLDEEKNLLRKDSLRFLLYKLFNNSSELSKIVKCRVPKRQDAYNDIRDNLEHWVEEAIIIRNDYP